MSIKKTDALQGSKTFKQRWQIGTYHPIEAYEALAHFTQVWFDEGKFGEDQDEVLHPAGKRPGTVVSITTSYSGVSEAQDFTIESGPAPAGYSFDLNSKGRDVKIVLGTGTYSSEAAKAFVNFVKNTEEQGRLKNNYWIGGGTEVQVECKSSNPYKTYTWEYTKGGANGEDYTAVYIREN